MKMHGKVTAFTVRGGGKRVRSSYELRGPRQRFAHTGWGGTHAEISYFYPRRAAGHNGFLIRTPSPLLPRGRVASALLVSVRSIYFWRSSSKRPSRAHVPTVGDDQYSVFFPFQLRPPLESLAPPPRIFRFSRHIIRGHVNVAR